MSGPFALLILTGAQAATGSTTAADLEADLFAAVFRQQKTELLDADANAQGIVLCLAIDPGGAPQSVSAETLRELRPRNRGPPRRRMRSASGPRGGGRHEADRDRGHGRADRMGKGGRSLGHGHPDLERVQVAPPALPGGPRARRGLDLPRPDPQRRAALSRFVKARIVPSRV